MFKQYVLLDYVGRYEHEIVFIGAFIWIGLWVAEKIYNFYKSKA